MRKLHGEGGGVYLLRTKFYLGVYLHSWSLEFNMIKQTDGMNARFLIPYTTV